MILQIALGIILAAILIPFIPALIALAIWGICALLAIGVVGAILALSWNYFGGAPTIIAACLIAVAIDWKFTK